MQLLAFFLFLSISSCLKFDLPGTPGGTGEGTQCFTLFIGNDVYVTGLLELSTGYHMTCSILVKDEEGNQVFSKKELGETTKFSFRTHHDPRDYDFCISNVLTEESKIVGYAAGPTMKRQVNLIVETGYDLFDEEGKPHEKLKPMEEELRKLELSIKNILQAMEYLKLREIKMRDTNESTNDRVKYFFMLSIAVLLGLGVWQIVYLRRFFQQKKLI